MYPVHAPCKPHMLCVAFSNGVFSIKRFSNNSFEECGFFLLVGWRGLTSLMECLFSLLVGRRVLTTTCLILICFDNQVDITPPSDLIAQVKPTTNDGGIDGNLLFMLGDQVTHDNYNSTPAPFTPGPSHCIVDGQLCFMLEQMFDDDCSD